MFQSCENIKDLLNTNAHVPQGEWVRVRVRVESCWQPVLRTRALGYIRCLCVMCACLFDTYLLHHTCIIWLFWIDCGPNDGIFCSSAVVFHLHAGLCVCCVFAVCLLCVSSVCDAPADARPGLGLVGLCVLVFPEVHAEPFCVWKGARAQGRSLMC